MAHVLQTNGDLLLKTTSAGDIVLDPKDGNIVRITSTMIVEGESISVTAENLQIEDNFININIGETGAGVTLQYAGLQVDRGQLAPANLYWDESIDAWVFATGEEGSFNASNNNVVLSNVLTDSNANNGDLTLVGAGTGVVTVTGTTDYEQQVTDDDHIPNKKYVDDRIISDPGHNVYAADTFVYAADSSITPGDPGSIQTFTNDTTHTTDGNASAVSIIVNGVLNSQFYSDRTYIHDLRIYNDASFAAILQNRTDGSNLFFKTDTTGRLQTNYALQLDRHSSVPAVVSGSTLIYADSPGAAGTGVYYVNDGDNIGGRQGELSSRRQALVYSMIF